MYRRQQTSWKNSLLYTHKLSPLNESSGNSCTNNNTSNSSLSLQQCHHVFKHTHNWLFPFSLAYLHLLCKNDSSILHALIPSMFWSSLWSSQKTRDVPSFDAPSLKNTKAPGVHTWTAATMATRCYKKAHVVVMMVAEATLACHSSLLWTHMIITKMLVQELVLWLFLSVSNCSRTLWSPSSPAVTQRQGWSRSLGIRVTTAVHY